jgi:lipoprotein-releasing system permease protein
MQKLNLIIGDPNERESISIYAPKRNVKIRPGKTPFHIDRMYLGGAMIYNVEINEEKVIWPLENARALLNYDKELTHILVEVDSKSGFSHDEVKDRINSLLGPNFNVLTNYEKNQLIYQTSKSERLIVVIILIFIFILASFNLIASLTMLFLEKKDNMVTMKSIGFTDKDIFNVFLYEGLLISGIGMTLGLILGYLICLFQIYFQPIVIPGPKIAFPVSFSLNDFLLIFTSISTLSFLFSYSTVRGLIKSIRNLEQQN